MNPWLVVPALVAVAVLYVLVPVGMAAAAHFRWKKIVRCPLTGQDASIYVERAAVAEILGLRSLRRVGACSGWPAPAEGCRQGCLAVPDEAMRDVRASV